MKMRKKYAAAFVLVVLSALAVGIYWVVSNFDVSFHFASFEKNGEGTGGKGGSGVTGAIVGGENTGGNGGGAGGSGESGMGGEFVFDSGSGIESGGRGAFLVKDRDNAGSRCKDFTNCTAEFDSVCGWFDSKKVVCSEGPCVKRFLNVCEACADERVLYWEEGECPFYGS